MACRIIVAEDDVALRFAMTAWLEQEGFEVVAVVATGQDAIAAIDEASPPADILLLDLGLPGVDGFGVLSHLRVAGSAVKVVVLTGRAPEEVAPRLEGLGVDRFMQKGRSPLELMDVLRELSCD